jgi:hypothetical protein
MELLVFILVLLLLWVVAVPAWLIAKMLALSSELKELRGQLLETKRARPQETTSAIPAVADPSAAVPESAPVIHEERPREPAREPPLPPPTEISGTPSGFAQEPPQVSAEPGAPARRLPAIDWEVFMGVKLFAWLGGLALFLGVVFLVKYSFDHDLIAPELRVALGYLAGTGLIVGGILVSKKKYAVTAQTLCATGIVILYAVTYVCHAVYEFRLFGTWSTLLLMVGITAGAFLLAVRLEARVVAVLGILGGFLTPLLLSTGEDNAFGLFSYIALLNAGLVAVALNRRWHFLVLLGAAGTVLLQIAWVAAFFVPEKALTAVVIFLVFNALFAAAYWAADKLGQGNRWMLAAAAGMPFVSMAFAAVMMGQAVLGAQPGLLLGFILLSSMCLLVPAMGRERQVAPFLSGGIISFLLLAVWTARHLDAATLPGGLAFVLAFAGLHSVLPFVLQRWRGAVVPEWYAQLFPPAAVVLLFLPLAQLPALSIYVWPVALMLDLLALFLALLLGSAVLFLAMLILTVLLAVAWLLAAPASLTVLPEMLLVTGGFGALFFIAATYAARKLEGRALSWFGSQRSENAVNLSALPQVPALSAILPFALLTLTSAHLPVLNPTPVFGAGLLLLLLLLGVGVRFRAHWAPLAGLGCVALMEWVWHVARFEPAAAPVALGWYLGFYAIFLAYPLALRSVQPGETLPWIAAAVAGPVQFLLVYRVVAAAFPNDFMGLLPALFAIPSAAMTWVAARRLAADDPARLPVLAWLGGVALFFVALVFPIQFEKEWVTLGWALQGVALIGLFHKLPHPGLRIAGVALLIVAFARLALNPAVLDYYPRSGVPIFNWHLYTYGVVTACLFVAARLLAPPHHRVLGRNAPRLLIALGLTLGFLLVNLQIADYFGQEKYLVLELTGNLARDMTCTLAWAGYALGLLAMGIWKRWGGTRHAGLALLSVALLKLFFYDLANLSQLYRIGALVGVAVIAIVASVLYQRFVGTDLKTAFRLSTASRSKSNK